MELISHALCTLLLSNDESTFKQLLAAVLYPDAVRAYTGARQYSHFEQGSINSHDVSWWVMPNSMMATKEEVQRSIQENAHLAEYQKSVLGEPTKINEFINHNKDLPKIMYNGIILHLKQDIIFDEFIRGKIDCSKKYDDEFIFRGKQLNGIEVRKLIAEIDQQFYYYLAKRVYGRFEIVCTLSWIMGEVKPILYNEYPKSLADETCKYLLVDTDVNRKIANKDWTNLDDGPLEEKDFSTLFTAVEKLLN